MPRYCYVWKLFPNKAGNLIAGLRSGGKKICDIDVKSIHFFTFLDFSCIFKICYTFVLCRF